MGAGFQKNNLIILNSSKVEMCRRFVFFQPLPTLSGLCWNIIVFCLVLSEFWKCYKVGVGVGVGAPNVAATWTTDGRIVCLLASGRKVTVTTEQQLRGLYEC